MRMLIGVFLMALVSPSVWADKERSPETLFGNEPELARATIEERQDCKFEAPLSIKLLLGATLADSLGVSIANLQSKFQEQIPKITESTRLYSAECPDGSGGKVMFFVRAIDLGNQKSVFREIAKP